MGARRRVARPIDLDPGWVISETEADPGRQRVRESLFTVAAGGLGTRGALEEAPPGSVPMVLVAGVYDGHGSGQRLLAGPDWTGVDVASPPEAQRRSLDLRCGVLVRQEIGADGQPLRTVRWASAARPGVVALRVEDASRRVSSRGPLTASNGHRVRGEARGTHGRWAAAGAAGTVLAAAAAEAETVVAGRQVLERVAAFAAGSSRGAAAAAAQRRLRSARRAGLDRLLLEQRATWRRRWANVDACVPDDPAGQLAVRFALYQLWSHSAHGGELAVGARGVTGDGYAGHVFWDADVYVLPAMAAIDPSAARAMLRYRFNRLAAAQGYARESGCRGARFPWESAADGSDVTPRSATFAGLRLDILTGLQEEHVTADIAWAAAFCARWEGRPPDRIERKLIEETARYWASRCRVGADGRAHVEHVIGPDEYHEGVDDNAFTNVMARWNLRQAAGLATDARPDERQDWRRLADALVDGYDPTTGRYEQFAGYFGLEDLTVAEVAPPPVAADLLLGPERIARSRLIKQADVLMLHHLVPEETEPGSLAPNLDFYLPRTAHGSSLSPAIVASLLARAGRPDEALELFRIALRMDLDDLTATTAGGLHLATIGGVWQCLLFGFAGVRVHDRCLVVDPCLPTAWPRFGLRFRALGRRVRVEVDGATLRVGADGPVNVQVGTHPCRVAPGADAHFVRKEVAWWPN